MLRQQPRKVLMLTTACESMRLLALSCSEKKTDTPGRCPALYRYDGPAYRIIRKCITQHGWPQDLDIFILSGKYGLIPSHVPIPWYDKRLDPSTVDRKSLSQEWARLVERGYDDIFVAMGAAYREVLGAIPPFATVACGRIGQQGSQLRSWLLSLY